MITFKLNVTDEKFVPGQVLLKKYPELESEFAKFIAKVMKYELKRAIRTQRYSKSWAPLSFNYIRFKRTHNLRLGIWESTGLLYKSIVARKKNGYYEIGIDPNRRYKSGVKVYDVARWMEYGTSRMPARPLFRPVITYIRKNMGRYWKAFLKERGIYE